MRNFISSLFLLLASTLFISCNYFKKRKEELKSIPVVKVYESVLYQNELFEVTRNSTPEDSAKMAAMYIQDWISRQLMIQSAKKNLSNELLDIEKKVEDYRESLIIFNYESELIKQKLDTSISIQDRLDYFKKYKENFILNEDIFRLEYIKLLKVTPNLEMWVTLMKSDKHEDEVLLKSFVKSDAMKFNLDANVWKSKDQICSELQISEALLSKVNAANKVYRMEDGEISYLFKLHESKKTGEESPFEYVNDKIYLILLNKKKSAFLEKISKEIYDDAIKANAIQQYSTDANTK